MPFELENDLMKRAGITWSEASKVVKQARTELGVSKNEPLTEELRVYCEKVLGIYDNNMPVIKILKSVHNKNNNHVDIDETSSNSESDDIENRRCKEAMKGNNNKKQSQMMLSKTSKQSSERSSLFRWTSSRKVSQEEEETRNNFFGRNVTTATTTKKSNNKNKNRKAKSSCNKSTELRENHLNDPKSRLIPLEALMLRRFDDLNYEDAASLVAHARTNLNASKWDAWTDDLYNECEKLYEISYGPMVDNTKYYEWEKTFYKTNSNNNGEDDNDDDQEEDNCNSLNGLRKPQEDDYESIDDDDESFGYQSSSGWSSLYDTNDNNDDFSISTHDKEDEYSIAVIKKLQEKAEMDEEEIVSIRSRVTLSCHHMNPSSDDTVGSNRSHAATGTRKSAKKSKKSGNNSKSMTRTSSREAGQKNKKKNVEKSTGTARNITKSTQKNLKEEPVITPTTVLHNEKNGHYYAESDEKTTKPTLFKRIFGCRYSRFFRCFFRSRRNLMMKNTLKGKEKEKIIF